MSHSQQLEALSIIKSSLEMNKCNQVLEIGSYDVNGSVRSIFDSVNYTGVDLVAGPGVDVVQSGHLVDLKKNRFNLVISSECFEHNPYWNETLFNMISHIEDGGYIIVTCAIEGRLEHGTARTNLSHSPGTNSVGWNYYKNINPVELRTFFKNNKNINDFFMFTQSLTYDAYVVASVGDSYKINKSQLRKLYRLYFTWLGRPKDVAFQIWLLPVRLMRLILSDNYYYTFGVYYERCTKLPLLKISKRLKRFL